MSALPELRVRLERLPSSCQCRLVWAVGGGLTDSVGYCSQTGVHAGGHDEGQVYGQSCYDCQD